MKLNRFRIKGGSGFIWSMAVLVAIAFTINGCKKPGDTFEDFEASSLRVVNAMPGPTNVRFFLDTFKLTLTGTLNYGVISSPAYYVVKSGTRTAKFAATDEVFAEKSIQLDPQKAYTLFLAGTQQSPEYFFTTDDLTEAAADKAKIRLANLGINLSTNIDVTIQLENVLNPQPEVKIFSGIAKSTVTDYISVAVPVSKGNAVIQPHTIRVYQAGTSNVLATVTAIDLRATTINTFILRGIKDGDPSLEISWAREWLDW